MENATKALLIAAAVLIAILLISLGIVVMRQGTSAVQDAGSGLDSAAIEQFNGKFSGYEGDHKSTTQVNALLKEVCSHNLQEAATGTNRFVEISAANIVTQATNATSAARVSGSDYYKVTCTFAGSGIVNKITISK